MEPDQPKTIAIEKIEQTLLVTLARPQARNALDVRMMSELRSLWTSLPAGVRCVVVTGEAPAFCAGADMSLLESDRADAAATAADELAFLPGDQIPIPVIAAVNGACAGLGLVHALMCDVRIADAGAKFTTAFSRRGLVAEHGLGWMLPRLIGPARALDLLLSGRVFLGSEAAELGVVNRAVEDGTALDAALDYAGMLARDCSPTSMAVMKQQVYADYDRTLSDSVEEANRLMLESFSRPDFGEGVQSFLERRQPRFEPVSGRPAGAVVDAV